MRTNFWLRLVSILVALASLLPFTYSHVLAGNPVLPDYVFPIPGSTRLNPETSIIVRFPGIANNQASFASSFIVTGQLSGSHSGRAVLSDDQATMVFTPDRSFTPGEKVQVSITPDWLANLSPYSYSFQVDPSPIKKNTNVYDSLFIPSVSAHPAVPDQVKPSAAQFSNYLTLPTDFPIYTIDKAAPAGDEGYYFTTPWRFDSLRNYLLIMDGTGDPVYYQAFPGSSPTFDFKKQPNGMLSYFDSTVHGFNVLDSSYQLVATYTARNGYNADVHDFQLMPNQHGVLLIYDIKIVDMSQIVPNGNPQAQVTGLVIQEQDGTGNVVFEWRSWDHIQITDTDNFYDLTAAFIDYVHGNAIQIDWDGNYLVSSRHLDEITKIDRRNGNIIWRLGGENNQFTFTNVDISQTLPFSHQHDIRRLANGNITLFDNRNLLDPFYSSAKEYSINEDTKTVTLVWEYRSNTPATYSSAMGNAQRLYDGNTVIGWGFSSTYPLSKQPDVTEVAPDGSKIFEMTFELPVISYRAYRFPWQGHPTWPPQISYKTVGDQITLGASWNGATDVAKFEFYAAPAPSGQPVLLGTVTKTSFESQWTFTGNLADYCYFNAVALDANDQPMMTSNQDTALGCEPFRTQIPLAVY